MSIVCIQSLFHVIMCVCFCYLSISAINFSCHPHRRHSTMNSDKHLRELPKRTAGTLLTQVKLCHATIQWCSVISYTELPSLLLFSVLPYYYFMSRLRFVISPIKMMMMMMMIVKKCNPRTGLVVFPLHLQKIFTAQTVSVEGEGKELG